MSGERAAASRVPARAAARTDFPDWRFAPNIGGSPGTYELENQAVDRAGHVLAAMRALAPWAGRDLVDLGCGTGYWLPGYAREARRVTGVEPDPALRYRAAGRAAGLANVSVVAGSAERTGLPSRSADVIHARFAYFFGPGSEAGVAEVLRVLRPGGTLVAVDNDYRWGEFAGLLAAAAARPPGQVAREVDAWWQERGARRCEVRSELRFARPADLDAVLRIEVPAGAAAGWRAARPAAASLSYGYVLFALTA